MRFIGVDGRVAVMRCIMDDGLKVANLPYRNSSDFVVPRMTCESTSGQTALSWSRGMLRTSRNGGVPTLVRAEEGRMMATLPLAPSFFW